MEIKTGLWKQVAKNSGQTYFSWLDNESGHRVTAFLSKEGKTAVRFIVENTETKEKIADIKLYRNEKKSEKSPLYGFVAEINAGETAPVDDGEEVPF